MCSDFRDKEERLCVSERQTCQGKDVYGPQSRMSPVRRSGATEVEREERDWRLGAEGLVKYHIQPWRSNGKALEDESRRLAGLF